MLYLGLVTVGLLDAMDALEQAVVQAVVGKPRGFCPRSGANSPCYAKRKEVVADPCVKMQQKLRYHLGWLVNVAKVWEDVVYIYSKDEEDRTLSHQSILTSTTDAVGGGSRGVLVAACHARHPRSAAKPGGVQGGDGRSMGAVLVQVLGRIQPLGTATGSQTMLVPMSGALTLAHSCAPSSGCK